MDTVVEQAKIIQDAGHRLTKARLAVLEVLAAADNVLDAAEILSLGRQIHPRLGRVSVYRTLELLSKLGLARKAHNSGGCHSFGRVGRPEGHYLLCRTCGIVAEFPCVGLGGLLDAIAQQSGFTIRGHLLQLEGVCPDCK